MTDLVTERAVDSSGAEPTAVAYDFLRPPRISRDRQSVLETIFGRFAVTLQALLSSRLRQPTDVVVGSVEQVTFGEYLALLDVPCASFVFDLGVRGGHQGILDVGTQLSLYMVDRMFGGPGAQDAPTPRRPLTQLERLVVKGVADRVLGVLADVWQDHQPFRPSQIGYESVPAALQIASREDSVLVVGIEVRAGGFNGSLTLCLPLAALEGFLQEKRGGALRDARVTPEDRAASRAMVEQTLRVATVPIVARLPLFTLRARDVAALAVGQVISTGHAVDVPLEVHVNGRRRFLGLPGRTKRTMGVRIIQSCPATQAEPTGRNARARVL